MANKKSANSKSKNNRSRKKNVSKTTVKKTNNKKAQTENKSTKQVKTGEQKVKSVKKTNTQPKSKVVNNSKNKNISQLIKEIDSGEYKVSKTKNIEEKTMPKHTANKRMAFVVLFALLFLTTFGVSFAYFVSRTTNTGVGIEETATTVVVKDTEIVVRGEINLDDLNIYPGHKNLSAISVTATGGQLVTYDLIWSGENTLNTTLNYYVYRTNDLQNPSINCELVTESSSSKIYYETCTENEFDELGDVVSSGKIPSTTESTEFVLLSDESLQATSEGQTIYYVVVLEYPNLDEPQNIDIHGTFDGVVSIKAEYSSSESPDPGPEPDPEPEPEPEPEIILLSDKILEDNGGRDAIERKGTPNFNSSATTNEGMYAATEGNGTTYYFRGAANNWVYFAGFYWRIIRVNANGSVRLIYQGTDVSGNGQVGTSTFNSSTNHNAYVGYMYGDTGTGIFGGMGAPDYAETHANETSSAIKSTLDNWYQGVATSLSANIDIEAGFCGDRSPSSGNGAAQQATTYTSQTRLESGKNPNFNCTNTNDLYTASGSSSGNGVLQYPVGLISADEVAFAGGVYGTNNTSFYLYTGLNYWTMTPYELEVSGSIFSRSYTAKNMYVGSSLNNNTVNGNYGVRPVINIKGDIQISSGTGTSSDPYVVVN